MNPDNASTIMHDKSDSDNVLHGSALRSNLATESPTRLHDSVTVDTLSHSPAPDLPEYVHNIPGAPSNLYEVVKKDRVVGPTKLLLPYRGNSPPQYFQQTQNLPPSSVAASTPGRRRPLPTPPFSSSTVVTSDTHVAHTYKYFTPGDTGKSAIPPIIRIDNDVVNDQFSEADSPAPQYFRDVQQDPNALAVVPIAGPTVGNVKNNNGIYTAQTPIIWNDSFRPPFETSISGEKPNAFLASDPFRSSDAEDIEDITFDTIPNARTMSPSTPILGQSRRMLHAGYQDGNSYQSPRVLTTPTRQIPNTVSSVPVATSEPEPRQQKSIPPVQPLPAVPPSTWLEGQKSQLNPVQVISRPQVPVSEVEVHPLPESVHVNPIVFPRLSQSRSAGIWSHICDIFFQPFGRRRTSKGSAGPGLPSNLPSEEPESFGKTASGFLLKTLPREIYLCFLLRLPLCYFGRVARIFEEADLSLSEIKQMVLEMAVKGRLDLHAMEKRTLPPQYEHLKATWQSFIDDVIREWKSFQVISVLLLSAILTMLQNNPVAKDPILRYSALFSLICALISLLFGCTYIIRFSSMRPTHKAAEWALEAKKTSTGIFWNVWVLLAMPVVWLSWSILLFLFCIVSFIWMTSPLDSIPPSALSSSSLFVVRLMLTMVLTLGVIYGMLILRTFKRYGATMDRAWKRRVNNWLQEYTIPPFSFNHDVSTPSWHSRSSTILATPQTTEIIPENVTMTRIVRHGPGTMREYDINQNMPSSSAVTTPRSTNSLPSARRGFTGITADEKETRVERGQASETVLHLTSHIESTSSKPISSTPYLTAEEEKVAQKRHEATNSEPISYNTLFPNAPTTAEKYSSITASSSDMRETVDDTSNGYSV